MDNQYDINKFSGEKNRRNYEIEKHKRKLIIETENAHMEKKLVDNLHNPSNYAVRNRSSSPPPKCKRSKKGINRGKADACSHCRPEFCNRIYKTSQIREEVRNNTQYPN